MKTINLSKNQYALVDDEDFEWLNQWKWTARQCRHTSYAARAQSEGEKRVVVYMHRVIVNAPKGLEVDHIDGNGLNNQKFNLRVCTTTENRRNRGKSSSNTSGYKGVSTSRNRYRAFISVNGKNLYLGTFDTPQEAAHAYDVAAIGYHGEYAGTNGIGDKT